MAAAAERPWCVGKEGLVVRVRVTPRSSREAIDGIETTAEGPAIKARVRAVPEDGAANAAVVELLAKWLGLSKRSVALVAGGKSRIKYFAIMADAVDLERELASKLSALQQEKDD